MLLQEFVHTYKLTENKLLKALASSMEKAAPAAAAAPVQEALAPMPPVAATDSFSSVCSSTSSCTEGSSCYYDSDEALIAAVEKLCDQLLHRCSAFQQLPALADAENNCLALELCISELEARIASPTASRAQRRAAKQQLDKLMDRKCLEADLACTLLEQHAAAEDLTICGPAQFEENWSTMQKLEGRLHKLTKKLAEQHGVKVALGKFPSAAADEVLMLAGADDVHHKRYMAWAWKMLQLVNTELAVSKQQLLHGLKSKSISLPGSLLPLRIAKGHQHASKATKR